MKPIVIKKDYQLLIESGKQKIMEIFFRFPDKEFSLSEIARLSKVAKSNINPILNEFHKLEFIEIIKLANLWRIKAKQDNWNFMNSKIVYNLNFIYQSGLVKFLVNHYKNPKAIILFGSFRKGDDITSSDIDIAIESKDVNDYQIISLKELSQFEKVIERKIQIHLFNREKIDIHLFNNIANGIILWGFLEVKK